MTNILTHLQGSHPALYASIVSSNSSGYALEYGELWEQAVAVYLSDHGIPAYRLCQRFLPHDILTEFRPNRQLPYRHCMYRVNMEGDLKMPKEDPSLYKPYQRDLAIKLSKTRRMLVEVKALTPAAFRATHIHVGDIGKWDSKREYVNNRGDRVALPPVGLLILANQQTGALWAVNPHDGWIQVPSFYRADQKDYAVPRSLLLPLELDRFRLEDTPAALAA
jgi:hypothetical protein